MIGDDVYGVDPWTIPEKELQLDLLAQTESIFALSNGHIGLRGNLDEGEPSGRSGTFLNGFYETRPLPYAEAGYGDPESGETMINVTNGKVLRLLVDDEPFDLRYGTVEQHTRTLDLRAGVLRREVHWRSPAGQGVILRTTRLVSFVQRAVAAISYEVEAYGEPRADRRAVRAHRQRAGARDDERPARRGRAAQAAAGRVERPPQAARRPRAHHARLEAARRGRDGPRRQLPAGGRHRRREREGPRARDVRDRPRARQCLRIEKFIAYGWSSRRSLPALRDQVDAALAAVRHTGWDEPRRLPARVPRRLLGAGPTSNSTATPRCSRRCASRCSRSCRPRRAPRAGRSRPRG